MLLTIKLNLLLKRNCVSTVAAQDTGGNNVAAEDVSSASQGIIQVFVTRLRIDHPVTTEPS